MRASRNASNDSRAAIWAATTAVRPAAGPATLVWDPLRAPTTMPPTIPASTPENKGALEARAMPRHNGRATRMTTTPERRSAGSVERREVSGWDIVVVPIQRDDFDAGIPAQDRCR